MTFLSISGNYFAVCGLVAVVSLPMLLPAWWRHQMETFSTLLAFCAGNSLVNSEFLSQRPVTQSFDVFFDLRLYKWSSKQLRHRSLETHHTHYEVIVMRGCVSMQQGHLFLQHISILPHLYWGFSVLSKLFMAPIQMPILRRFEQVIHAIPIWCITDFFTFPMHDFTCLGRMDGWLGRTLGLSAHAEMLCISHWYIYISHWF